MKTYTITPLEWTDDSGGSVGRSNTGLNIYVIRIQTKPKQWRYHVEGIIGINKCRSLADGKRKAEAAYITKILGALTEVTTQRQRRAGR